MFDHQAVQLTEIRRLFSEEAVPLTKNTLHGTAIMRSPTWLCDIFSQRDLMGICPNQDFGGHTPAIQLKVIASF
jgi:hypothetical protein